MDEELWRNDASALSEKLHEGSLNAVELLTHYQRRIAAINPKINAIICLNPQAQAQAQASAKRYADGQPLSLIDGMPLVVKDNLIVSGMATTWGSRLFAGKIAETDELPIERLRRAGAVFIGKSNVPELTLDGVTDNELFGLTTNPWNTHLTPGGSSGGSAAAVAAGLTPLAVGTDGGGSIRRPAAYTNLVGLKPSIGRIPRHAGLPQILLDMEVVGPITRSVRDQAMLFDVMAGPDVRDHRSTAFAAGHGLQRLSNPPETLRILAVERFGNAPLDPVIRASFRQTAALLADLGHQVETGALPFAVEPINRHWPAIGEIGLARLMATHPAMRKLASERFVALAQAQHTGADLLEIIETINELRNQASSAFESVDIILTPTCAAMPWSNSIPYPATINNQPVGPRGPAVYTGWVNACGHPALSIPSAIVEPNAPIGMQLVGGLGQEERLLRLAAQIEQRQDWTQQWPTLATRQ